jgi:hypothetical protein
VYDATLAETVRFAGNDGDAFFAVNRPMYRPEAANEGWPRIWDFYGRYR